MAQRFKAKTLLSNSGVFNNEVIAPNLVYNTGNQTIGGVKTFAGTGVFNTLNLNNISGLSLSGVDITITSGKIALTNRPTVNSTGILLSGDVTEYIFTGDLAVSLTNNKTFGRYTNGQIIPASGKTTSQVLQLALVEPIPPTVSLTSATTIAFNQISISNILNASHIINSLNASIFTGYLEWRRGGVGSYSQLTDTLSSSFSFTHSLTDTNFNTSGFNYRYVVKDSISGQNTGTLTITPTSYVAPSLSSISIGSSTADLGNISTTLAATINRNSTNVSLTGYQLQFHSGDTNWTNIDSPISISGPSHSFSTGHNNGALINVTSIAYRVQVGDTYQTTPLTLGTRSFLYRNYLGYSSNTSLILGQIEALASSVLSNSKTRTVTSVAAGVGNYTYYCYRAADGDLSSIIQDGAAPIYGAFTKLSDVAGTNSYGASVTYRVYKSNSTAAFTNNSLAFS